MYLVLLRYFLPVGFQWSMRFCDLYNHIWCDANIHYHWNLILLKRLHILHCTQTYGYFWGISAAFGVFKINGSSGEGCMLMCRCQRGRRLGGKRRWQGFWRRPLIWVGTLGNTATHFALAFSPPPISCHKLHSLLGFFSGTILTVCLCFCVSFVHTHKIELLSDPGIPGQIYGSQANWVRHLLQTQLMWLWLMKIPTQY